MRVITNLQPQCVCGTVVCSHTMLLHSTQIVAKQHCLAGCYFMYTNTLDRTQFTAQCADALSTTLCYSTRCAPNMSPVWTAQQDFAACSKIHHSTLNERAFKPSCKYAVRRAHHQGKQAHVPSTASRSHTQTTPACCVGRQVSQCARHNSKSNAFLDSCT
jgi:hypothetical protein